jgi:hypothetical protein
MLQQRQKFLPKHVVNAIAPGVVATPLLDDSNNLTSSPASQFFLRPRIPHGLRESG